MPLNGMKLGHYQLVKQIGGGGMSEVYLAQDLNLSGRQVAMKLVRAEVAPYPDSDANRDSGKLFQREARAIALLDRHPHILPLYEFGEEHVQGVTITYIVMPYCPEGSLASWLRQRSRGILSPQEVEFIISQAADALQYAHSQHVIHRDVKPSNFLIQRLTEANLPYIQLADFGIARINTGTSSMSQSGRGTTTYMPPEQWRGHPVPATDQYALAIMAYELLTGRPPFQGDVGRLMYLHSMEKPQPPSTFNPNLSSDIDAVILHALEKEPEQRFKSISAFANAFQQAVRADSVVPIPPPPPPPRDETLYPVSQPSGAVLPTVPADGGNINPGGGYSMPFAAGQGYKTSGTAYVTPSPYGQTPPASFTPPVLPKQPWYRSRMTLIASIGLVLLLLLSGVIYAVTATGKSTPTPTVDTTATAKSNNATATTQAIANATATAHVHATSTAIARATAQVIAANPDPYSPTNGRLALLDPLTGGTSDANWNTKSGCLFANGGYHTSENQSGSFNACYLERPPFNNFALQVDMTVIKGDCGGIVFRANSATGKEYFFRVCQDNQMYYLYNCPGFSVSCKELTSHFSSDINTGLNQMNRIALVADGSGIDLYINNTKQDSITDTAYASGNIGLTASTINNHTEAVFQNLKVWAL